MVMKVASPRKASLTEVLQRVYGNFSANTSTGYSNNHHHHHHHHQPKKYLIHETENDFEEEDGTMELVQIGAERTKNVLILMSDTGGGHRASAEAIRDAFKLEYGDEYRVCISLCSCLDLYVLGFVLLLGSFCRWVFE